MSTQKFEEDDDGTLEESAEQQEVDVLEFELNGEGFCVEIGYIAEIFNCGEITNLPSTPPHIEGVVNLRDEAVKVVNLKELLDLEGEYENDKLLVFKREENADSRFGWLVDGVRGVESFVPAEVEAGGDVPGMEGVIQQDEDFIVWLDPAEVRI